MFIHRHGSLIAKLFKTVVSLSALAFLVFWLFTHADRLA